MMMKLKTILLLISWLAITLPCKAQQIIPMNNDSHTYDGKVYYKDTENFIDKFVGRWKYQYGQETFMLKLNKKIKYDHGHSYADTIYGEYSYTKNPININTIGTLPSNADPGEFNISGALFIENNQFTMCNDCLTGEQRLRSYLYDPTQPHVSYSITFRYINPTTIKTKVNYLNYVDFTGNAPEPVKTIPLNFEFTMTKQ